MLRASGLEDPAAWHRSYHQLSASEKQSAEIAVLAGTGDRDLLAIDDFGLRWDRATTNTRLRSIAKAIRAGEFGHRKRLLIVTNRPVNLQF